LRVKYSAIIAKGEKMKSINQTYTIAATPAEVWRALTEPELIEEWSGADAKFEPTVGVEYSLWDGSIVGKIVKIVPHQKLVQTWKPDDWTIENSVVTFTLTPTDDGTLVELLHENVEEFDFEGTTEGWDLYYLGAIKRMFEAKPRSAKPAKKAKAAKGKKMAAKKKVAVKKSGKKTAKKKK
jgi:uncharacterized protein YndB with AHSA1/START domain